MPNEYYAIILEFTPKSVNLGFAGESDPHVSIEPSSSIWKSFVCFSESETRYPSVLGLNSHALLVSEREQMVASLTHEQKNAVSQFSKGFGPRWFQWESDNYRTLAKLVKYLILSLLLVSNVSAKVFVVDGGLSATLKFQLCDAFLARKVATAVSFVPRAPCVMMAAGVENGLLVDFGWDECSIVSIFDLRCVSSKRLSQFAEENVHYLSQESGRGEFSQLQITAEDELIQAVFLSGDLSKAIWAEISSLDIDCRSPVAHHIVFCGLLAKIPGLTDRILTDVKLLAGAIPTKEKRGLGPWAGASLYCSVSLLKEEKSGWRSKEITKEKLHESWNELQLHNL